MAQKLSFLHARGVNRLRSPRARNLTIALASSLLTALALGDVAAADSALANRYPYDPACAYGRVADGKGMIVRCMSSREAKQVLESARLAKLAKAQAAKAAAAPSASATNPSVPTEPKPDPAEPNAKPGPVKLRFGELKVDEGDLPQAIKQLGRVTKRLEACVQDNGGLTQHEGELRVRFLVRERGRAEGVEVERRKAMSEKAGKCVADVIDRRLVGHPSVPITGASLQLLFARAQP